jgi:hypothetical protein
MSDAEKRDPKTTDEEKGEFGWEFHKIPLLIALVLTVLFYVIVYWLASVRP